jgi:ABC-type transport system involved in Fe-S cluster assembly fused permease/ATPase subunit
MRFEHGHDVPASIRTIQVFQTVYDVVHCVCSQFYSVLVCVSWFNTSKSRKEFERERKAAQRDSRKFQISKLR